MNKNYVTLKQWAELYSLSEEEALIVAKAQKQFILSIKAVRFVNSFAMDSSFSSYIFAKENIRETKREILKNNVKIKQNMKKATESFLSMGLEVDDIVDLKEFYVANGLTNIDKIKESINNYVTTQKLNITIVDLKELEKYLIREGKTLVSFLKEVS